MRKVTYLCKKNFYARVGTLAADDLSRDFIERAVLCEAEMNQSEWMGSTPWSGEEEVEIIKEIG